MVTSVFKLWCSLQPAWSSSQRSRSQLAPLLSVVESAAWQKHLPSAACRHRYWSNSKRTSRGYLCHKRGPRGWCRRGSCGRRSRACCCRQGAPEARRRRESCGTSGFACKTLGRTDLCTSGR